MPRTIIHQLCLVCMCVCVRVRCTDTAEGKAEDASTLQETQMLQKTTSSLQAFPAKVSSEQPGDRVQKSVLKAT